MVSISPSRLGALREVAQAVLSELDAMTVASLSERAIAQPIDFYREMRSFKIALVRWAMVQAGGKQKVAAKLLGLAPTSLNSIIKKCGLASSKSSHNLFSTRRSVTVVTNKAKDHSHKPNYPVRKVFMWMCKYPDFRTSHK